MSVLRGLPASDGIGKPESEPDMGLFPPEGRISSLPGSPYPIIPPFRNSKYHRAQASTSAPALWRSVNSSSNRCRCSSLSVGHLYPRPDCEGNLHHEIISGAFIVQKICFRGRLVSSPHRKNFVVTKGRSKSRLWVIITANR